MSATLTNLTTRFNTRLRDATNATWTSAEKADILTTAINDPYVYIVDIDTSLETLATTRSYPMPSNFEAIYSLGVDVAGDGFPMLIDVSAYDVINGNIYISEYYKAMPVGKPIHILGKHKLTTTSTFPDFLVDYILEYAMVEAFEMLKTSLTSRFLKNDMTMNEIVTSINTHRAEMMRLQKRIANQQLVRL